jgi:hypothetical protein
MSRATTRMRQKVVGSKSDSVPASLPTDKVYQILTPITQAPSRITMIAPISVTSARLLDSASASTVHTGLSLTVKSNMSTNQVICTCAARESSVLPLSNFA